MALWCKHALRFCVALPSLPLQPNLCLLLSRLLLADRLIWDLTESYLWLVLEYHVESKDPLTFLSGPCQEECKGLLSLQGCFVLSSLSGKFTIMIYSVHSGAQPFTCGLWVSQRWSSEASSPCCESVFGALGLGAPSHRVRKQEGWKDSAGAFFPGPSSQTLITFCCGKEMRWGLKTDHCPPPRLMQRKRYCLLNG